MKDMIEKLTLGNFGALNAVKALVDVLGNSAATAAMMSMETMNISGSGVHYLFRFCEGDAKKVWDALIEQSDEMIDHINGELESEGSDPVVVKAPFARKKE